MEPTNELFELIIYKLDLINQRWLWGRRLSREFEIFENFGIYLPGIRDFFKSGDFYPRGLGIFENLGIFLPGIRNFLNLGTFIHGIGHF